MQTLIPDLIPAAMTLLIVVYGTQSLTTISKFGLKNLLKNEGRVVAATASLATTYRVSSLLIPLIENLLKELSREGISNQQGDRLISFLNAMVDEISLIGEDREEVIR